MNKTVIWAIIGVLVVGGLIYLMMGNDADAPNNGEEQVQEDESVATVGTFRELLNSGQSQRCTFSDDEANSEGTVYVSGGRMRGDFTADVNGTDGMGHMIVKDNTFYMWMDGQSQGFQFSLEGEAQTEMMDTNLADLDREVDYDCDATTVLESQFELPTGVTFTDFSQFSL